MLKRFLLGLLIWTAGPVPADVIIDIVNEGNTRWLCVEVVDGKDVVISRHTAQSKAEACMLTQQLIHPDRVFRAVGQERLRVIVSPEAQALLVKYTLAQNGSGSTVGAIRTTAFPAGNAPLDTPGASCTHWTKAEKGNATGEIDCEIEATVTISGTGADSIFNNVMGYQTFADTGDGQVKARIPSAYTGNDETFTSGSIDICEGPGADDWCAKVFCPLTGSMRFATGTAASNSAAIGVSGSCLNRYAGIYYDQSAGILVGLESADGVNYTQIGSNISRTLSCETGTCLAGPSMYGRSGLSATGTFANADVSTEIDLVVDPGDPDPPPTGAGEVWSGDFSTGNFLQWPQPGNPDAVTFSQVSAVYGRPIQYGGQIVAPSDCPSSGNNTGCHIGNGDLLALCNATGSGIYEQCPFGEPPGPSSFAARFTVKNSANGSEPNDCDKPTFCSRRRTELTAQSTMQSIFQAFPAVATRWWTFSIWLPANYSDAGSGFGNNVLGIKPRSEASGGSFGTTSLMLANGNWRINHRWASGSSVPPSAGFPWQQAMFYTGGGSDVGNLCYPRASGPAPLWADGVQHFPNEAASCAALQSVNKGGWTHWVVHIHTDNRGAGAGGNGFLRYYKREDDGPWVKVVDIAPGSITRGGETFDMGIGFGSGSNGYGPKAGHYMDKNQVWGLSNNRVYYLANIRFFDGSATCSDVTFDSSNCEQ